MHGVVALASCPMLRSLWSIWMSQGPGWDSGPLCASHSCLSLQTYSSRTREGKVTPITHPGTEEQRDGVFAFQRNKFL